MPDRACEHSFCHSRAQRRRAYATPVHRFGRRLACACLVVAIAALLQPACAGGGTSSGTKPLSASTTSQSINHGTGNHATSAGRSTGAGQGGGKGLRRALRQGGSVNQTFHILTRGPGTTFYTPVESYPKPVSPGTHTSVSLARADGTLTYQVLVSGGTRSVLPTGWAQAPKPQAIAMQYLPLPKFAHEGGGGGGETPHATLITVSNGAIHFQSAKSLPGAIGHAQSIAETDASLSLVALPRSPQEIDDLTQFLWYCLFYAGLIFVLWSSVLAVRRATA